SESYLKEELCALEEEGFEVVDHRVVPDDKIKVQAALKVYCREFDVDLVVTTGGTGLSPRDVTPEATAEVIETQIPGLAEAIRAHGQARTPYAMLSRAKAGLIGRSLVVNLPGAKRAVEEGLQLLFPGLLHAFKMTGGVGHENGMSGREGPHPEGERKG
ncbi:MAG: molybdenum cofactor biosynthesis protein B, partial [Candidatus Bipolaricaulia bacterium]